MTSRGKPRVPKAAGVRGTGARKPARVSGDLAYHLALGTLFVVALVWRLTYLHRLALTPLDQSLTEDARIYWTWSGALLQHGLRGHNAFFLGPLYPYVLWVIRVLGGNSIPAVLNVQAVLGAAAVVLLADAAARCTRRPMGLVVGLLLCFYQMATFFDGLILMESLLFFVEALLLWWIARTDWARGDFAAFLSLGLLVGVLAEGRATAIVLLVVAAVMLVPWAVSRRIALRSAAMVLGFALICVPVAIRNHAVSNEWLPFTYNLGYNLYVEQNPQATGGFVRVTGAHADAPASAEAIDGGAEIDGREYLKKTEGVTLTPSASSRYWSSKAWRFAAEHPAQASRLFGRKLVMALNRTEYPQIENVDEYRALAGPLGIPFACSACWGWPECGSRGRAGRRAGSWWATSRSRRSRLPCSS